jgi:hypothetical protein
VGAAEGPETIRSELFPETGSHGKCLGASGRQLPRTVQQAHVRPVCDSSLIWNAGRYHYSELLKSGIKIYERRDVLLHAKTAVIDGVWSTVGSTNMDFWSLSSNDEVNAVILDKEFASEMEKMFTRDLEESDEILLEQWEKKTLVPPNQRVVCESIQTSVMNRSSKDAG